MLDLDGLYNVSHTSSELSIIKGSLYRGRLTDHSPLHKQETETNQAGERGRLLKLYISIYNTRDHAQAGWYHKGY